MQLKYLLPQYLLTAKYYIFLYYKIYKQDILQVLSTYPRNNYKSPLTTNRNEAQEYLKRMIKLKIYDNVLFRLETYQVGYDNKVNTIFGDNAIVTEPIA